MIASYGDGQFSNGNEGVKKFMYWFKYLWTQILAERLRRSEYAKSDLRGSSTGLWYNPFLKNQISKHTKIITKRKYSLDHIRCLRSPNNLKDIIFINLKKSYIFVMPWDQGSFWPMNKITSGRGEFQAVRISKREGENLRRGLTCSISPETRWPVQKASQKTFLE